MNTKLVIEDQTEVLHQRLDQLNMLRKSRHFCDVVLQVSAKGPGSLKRWLLKNEYRKRFKSLIMQEEEVGQDGSRFRRTKVVEAKLNHVKRRLLKNKNRKNGFKRSI